MNMCAECRCTPRGSSAIGRILKPGAGSWKISSAVG